MNPSAIELEKWWLTHGFASLLGLVNPDGVDVRRQDCGFSQTVQRKLRAFDGNRDRHAELCDYLQHATPSEYGCNPRGTLSEATSKIFRKAEHGGLDQCKALYGLAMLESVEAHRRQLCESAILVSRTWLSGDRNVELIENLHEKTAHRYGQFQLGFRVCVSSGSFSNIYPSRVYG